jgi:hypothetical protein
MWLYHSQKYLSEPYPCSSISVSSIQQPTVSEPLPPVQSVSPSPLIIGGAGKNLKIPIGASISYQAHYYISSLQFVKETANNPGEEEIQDGMVRRRLRSWLYISSP